MFKQRRGGGVTSILKSATTYVDMTGTHLTDMTTYRHEEMARR